MFQMPAIIQTASSIDQKRKITIYYPVVTGISDALVQQSINSRIIKNLNQVLKERNIFEPSLEELQAWYEVKTNERGVLSIAMYVYSYTGGAHGMTTIRTLTLDITTGKQFKLSQLFKKGTNYQEVILDMIKKQIKERNIPVINEPVTLPNDHLFYIADKSLIIYYQLYDLAPYVYGITYFPISVYSIQSIIDENGPLGEMLASY